MEPAIRRDFADALVPETFPAYAALEADPLGFLWVRRYAAPGEPSGTYDVIGPEDVLVAEVSIPMGNGILQIGEEFILTLHRDEWGVQTVRLYTLARR